MPRMLALLAFVLAMTQGANARGKDKTMGNPILYRTVKVDELTIFYRETGSKDAPTILLLHGLPSSSRMFQPLLTRLPDNYHRVAPDYPGFGHSDWPDPKQFASRPGRAGALPERRTGPRCARTGSGPLRAGYQSR
jgi:hypothetical protein